MAAHQQQNKARTWFARSSEVGSHALPPSLWPIHGIAALVLIIILAANILIWPVPSLGFGSDIETHQVVRVEPGSPAGRAGLRVGDHLLAMYDRPWTVVLHNVSFIDWVASREHPVPVVVARNEQTLTLAIPQDPPSLSLQLSKLAEAALASICWLTGYLLGIARQHTVLESRRVAFFWLGLGGIVGSAIFAFYAALPLFVLLVWLVIGVFVPFSIYMHLWFPARPVAHHMYRRATKVLFATWIVVNGSIASVVLATPMSLLDLVNPLLALLPGALVVGLVGSGWVLYRDYKRTKVAQTCRQIRLIATACAAVACVWILGRILPTLTTGQTRVPSAVLHLVCSFVPLAYLVSIGTPDLIYHIDRVAIRFLIHFASTTVLGLCILLLLTQLHLHGTAAVIALATCIILLYRPLQYGLQRLLPVKSVLEQEHRALDATIVQLAETLDMAQLATSLVKGIQEAFSQPAFALFLSDTQGTNTLTLWRQAHFDNLPSIISEGTLTNALRHVAPIMDSRRINHYLSTASITVTEQHLINHPSTALWCSIRHTSGHLLGILILGIRGDLDLYRQADRDALHRLVNAAALAFAHSAEYAQRQEAEGIIRQLYRRLQTERDRTAQEIAQGIHDDILNGTLRLNIEAVRKIAATNTPPALQQEINLVLETMQAVSSDLRNICEDVHPTGLDDLFGLPAVLSAHVQKMQARWHGQCQFTTTGVPQPIAASTQREALRITKEALVNSEKHAQASEMLVHLEYPTRNDECVHLSICDNGSTNQAITSRRGNLGVRQMIENAHAVGGTLQINQCVGKGTTVIFSFSALTQSMEHHEQTPAINATKPWTATYIVEE